MSEPNDTRGYDFTGTGPFAEVPLPRAAAAAIWRKMNTNSIDIDNRDQTAQIAYLEDRVAALVKALAEERTFREKIERRIAEMVAKERAR